MDSSSVMTLTSRKETTNYARLCRLLVDVGSLALRETFDKIHPPALLYTKLSSHPVRARLELLYKGRHKILNRTQWEKLYPADHSSVSSGNFDMTLLMVLLRNISGLKPPNAGWNNLPAATENSTEADIARVRIFRNKLAHTSEASFDDQTFCEHWQNIRQTLIRLGGKRYGASIDTLRGENMDPDIEVYYQKLLKRWAEDEALIEQLEGTIASNPGCVYAQATDISVLDLPVQSKVTSTVSTATTAVKTVIGPLQFLGKRKPRVSLRYNACRLEATPPKEAKSPHTFFPTSGLNRIPETREDYTVTKKVITLLEEAINFHQSDHITKARRKLQDVYQTVSEVEERYFKSPTKRDLRVVNRGKQLFLEDNVSCSVKHGTLLLDSSNSGAQFYISLINVIAAFAVVISEFRIAEEIFLLLTGLHYQSDVTSRRRDLGAAYNNRGCMSLILGDLKQAEYHFETSLKHLDYEKRHHPNSSSLETMFIVVNCNIARVHFLSRNFPEALENQEKLVKQCKDKEIQEMPLQVLFTVLNNQAVLCTTVGHLSKAEHELKWLISYLYKMNREDCEFLLNFVSLHLSEVLLLHGRPKEADKASRLDTLKSADGIELVQMFGGLHINVRIEAVEKLVEVIFLKGKIRFACQLLETGVKVLTKCFGPDHFNVASLLHKQGTILSRIGEVSSATEKIKSSIDIFQEIFGVKHPLLLRCYMSLGELTLRLERKDDSYLCFQRAMENIEEIFDVSFVRELSRKYIEITTNRKPFRGRMVWNDTQRIEGLVAEYGLAFAVLLSRSIVEDDNSSVRRPEKRKPRTTTCTMEIISLKYTSDFLQIGKTFLRQGMNKEAAAFFQQAERYCAAYSTTQSPGYPFLARLYSVIAKKHPGNQKLPDNNDDLADCFEELKEATTKVITESRSKTTTDDTTLETSDCRLNLQLVLILLILLSIELKMIDTTFAAYDLYAKLSQNDESFLLFLNGGVQIHASRTSITCNGKTVVQDVLVSSAAGLTEDNSECSTSENQLFRSLACKRNVSSDRFLVTYNSSILLDIDDLQVLESKISLSVQECFRLKCFESAIEGNAIIQVAIDLTSNSTSDDYDILAAGRRIELLSLCLSEEKSSGVFHKGNISEISTAMRQKTTRLTFEDEQTSSFMFSKNALSLLEQYNSKQISTLSVKRQCLSMTIAHPVKVRITLWRVEKCIKQKIQLVQTAARHDQRGCTVSQPTSCKETVVGLNVTDRLYWPSVDHWAKTYHVKFLTDDVDSDEPLDVSVVPGERNRIIFDKQHESVGHISSEETEQNEALRKYLNDSVLEGLTVISNLSRQIDDDWKEEDVDIAEVAGENAETSPLSSISESQSQQDISSSFLQASFNPGAETERNNFTLEALHSTAVEDGQWAREENSMSRVDDANELGRSLFEQDRRSRRSFMAEVQEILREKETLRESNVVNADHVSQEDRIVTIGSNKAETSRGSPIAVRSDDNPPRIGNTFTSFEEPAFNPDAEVEAHNSPEPWVHVENAQRANENASGRQLCEKYRESRSAFDATFKSPKIVETSQKLNCPEDEKNCKDTPGKQDSFKGLCSDETQNDESCHISGASGQVAQEGGKENNVETILENFIAKVEVEDAGQFNSHRNTLLKGPGQRTHTATHVEIDRATSDDDVPDGPTNGTLRRNQSNTNHLLPLTDTNFVDRTSERINNIQIDSEDITENETEMGDLGRSNVGDNYNKALQNGPQQKQLKKTTFLHPCCGFMGGDVLTDGDISNASHERKEAFETCQDSSKKESEDQTTSFQLNVARDAVDAPVCSPQVETEVKETAPVFGGARPKERSTFTTGSTSTTKTAIAQPTFAYSYNETETRGINPRFQARHTLKSNGAILEASLHDYQDDPFFSAKAMAYSENLRAPLERLQPPDYPFDGSSLGQYAMDLYATRTSTRGEVQSRASYRKPTLRQNESWHFPPLETPEITATQSNCHGDQGCATKQHSIPLEDSILPKVEALFNSFESRSAYNEMDSMTNDFHSSKENFDYWPVQSSTGIVSQQNSINEYTSSLLGSLKQVMAKTVELITSGNAVRKQPRQEPREMEKIGIQEETREYRKEEEAVRLVVETSRNQVESSQENEQVLDTERQPMNTPVQESPRPVCSHYQRRCLVRFPCCDKFYPCHRCHNESEDCSDDQARAINATHIRCTICYHEQAIDEQSQNCGGCKSKMSEYFCPTCKHFTSIDKNPFHCDKCGICRIHRDRSFHCDVCNVCLDKRLQGKHKCRPDSGHDECCICLEDAFSGCQILPCSHKVHKDCAIAMIQNGVRTCPICRHPLFSQPQNSSH